MKVVRPSRLSAVSVPSCAAAICAAICRPSPRPFVAEPELVGRFSKWNNNAGGVASVCGALAQLSVSQGIIEEGDEENDDAAMFF